MAGGYQICSRKPHRFYEVMCVCDPDFHPGRGLCILSWTPGMVQAETRLNTWALRATMLGSRPPTSPRNVRERNLVLRWSKELFCEGVPISFKPSDRRRQAKSTKVCFFTKLSLDGLPHHIWEEEAVRGIVNELEGELVEMIPAEDACCLGLFAWFENPGNLPLMTELQVVERPGSGRPSMARGASANSAPAEALRSKQCLTYDIFIHVEEVVNPTLLNISDPIDDDKDEDVTRCNTFDC
ncbi:hypothetical protein E2562_011931 [Oryza meyeriana var. granulata]|uniref:DUF4283 domain-containing protein n=1 Tax=Oryza meyeriana var. granulata TaxID=110450 RepID=A0A6G1CFC4_9ORYZ|nr:hypothetical protein E2562_011931 [Oryza meyeriana var. granulata]